MKLVTYEVGKDRRFGALSDGGIVELAKRLGVADLKSFLAQNCRDDASRLIAAGPDISVDDVRLLPPIPDPQKIICVGLNYREHVSETGMKDYAFPTLFLRAIDTLVGHRDSIWRPRNSTALDFEGELAVVIGKPGRYIDQANAIDHVAGYACFNDASLRDWQFHTSQVSPGKNFPHTGGFGPWIVTADEVPEIDAMHLTTRLNGQVMQSASVADLIFKIERLVAYCSGFTPLNPGDVIATGTPAGIGNGRTPKIFMKSGDTIEVEISGVGILSNIVADEPLP